MKSSGRIHEYFSERFSFNSNGHMCRVTWLNRSEPVQSDLVHFFGPPVWSETCDQTGIVQTGLGPDGLIQTSPMSSSEHTRHRLAPTVSVPHILFLSERSSSHCMLQVRFALIRIRIFLLCKTPRCKIVHFNGYFQESQWALLQVFVSSHIKVPRRLLDWRISCPH